MVQKGRKHPYVINEQPLMRTLNLFENKSCAREDDLVDKREF